MVLNSGILEVFIHKQTSVFAAICLTYLLKLVKLFFFFFLHYEITAFFQQTQFEKRKNNLILKLFNHSKFYNLSACYY